MKPSPYVRKLRAYLKQLRGVVLYEGPSQLDGAPIVVIATLRTTNGKTGDMVQTWILRADVNPLNAINTGADSSICGACPLRGKLIRRKRRLVNVGRACYVQIRNAPRGIYFAWRRGRYAQYSPAMHASLFTGRKLRLGSYGDPCAVPMAIWESVLSLASGHTGYTHSWRSFPSFRSILMASVDSATDRQDARRRGWRTFRTLSSIGHLVLGESICPASDEGGKRTQCDHCLRCRGSHPRLQDIAIVAHGSPSVLSSYNSLSKGI